MIVEPPTTPSPARPGLLPYLARLSGGRFVLWCYLFYWAVVIARYFDPSWRLWATSLGLSGIIGFALYLNATRSSAVRVTLGRWPTFRLFLTPFCVSSFSAVARTHGFWLIFSPTSWQGDLAWTAALGGSLGLAALVARRAAHNSAPRDGRNAV